MAAAGVLLAAGLASVWARAPRAGAIAATPDDLQDDFEEPAFVWTGPETQHNHPAGPATTQVPPPDDGGVCVMQQPLTEVELAELLQESYEAFFGHAPTANRLACAWAHCAFEHARGKKLFGNNIGHITTTGVWQGPTCSKTFTHRTGTNPDRWATTTQTFRVHPTLMAGALDYWRLMDRQYPGVMIACDKGDALTAAKELRKRHYFTGPENRYVRSLAQLYLEALGKVIPNTKRPAWPIGPKD